jgi:hypothetical protein
MARRSSIRFLARRRAGRLPMFSRPMSLMGVAQWK